MSSSKAKDSSNTSSNAGSDMASMVPTSSATMAKPPPAGAASSAATTAFSRSFAARIQQQQHAAAATRAPQQPNANSASVSALTLETRLKKLRDESNELSQSLTAKLASSEGGQNLLQLGHALSTIPPDVQSLLAHIKPLARDVESYVDATSREYERVTVLGREIVVESVRSRNARECICLFEDLMAGERDVRWNGNSGTTSEPVENDQDGDAYTFLEHVASLERCAHTTLHLLEELDKSTRQLSAVTGGGGSSSSSTAATKTTSISTSTSLPAAGDTERAQFLTKLAPRIRRLESDTVKCLTKRLESVLAGMNSSSSSSSSAASSSSLVVGSSPASGGFRSLGFMDDRRRPTKTTTSSSSSNKPSSVPSGPKRDPALEALLSRVGVGSGLGSSSSSSANAKGNAMSRSLSTASEDTEGGVNEFTSSSSVGNASKGDNAGLVLSNPREELLAIGHCLRGLALLGKGEEAESVFARVAIMPVIRTKISIGRLDEGGSRGECAGLFSLLDEIACTVSTAYGPVLRLSESIFSSSSRRLPGESKSLLKDGEDGTTKKKGEEGYDAAKQQEEEEERRQYVPNLVDVDLVTAGVWVPVATTLMADPAIKLAIFSPGIASILQANFVAIDMFLSELAERLLSSKEKDGKTEKTDSFLADAPPAPGGLSDLYYTASLTTRAINAAQGRIYRHEVTRDFTKKWNLPIYYQLRFGESCARLNRAIGRVQLEGWNSPVFAGSPTMQTSLREKVGFELPVFLELYDILLTLWRADVILRPLTHRFLRGAVQLLGRMVAFVKDGLEGKTLFGLGSDDAKHNGVNGGGAKKMAMNAASTFSWGDNAEDVATVAWELTVLESGVTSDYLDTIVDAVAPTEGDHQCNLLNTRSELEELRTAISEVLVEACQDIAPLIETSWNDKISKLLTKRCIGPLSAVKGVAATYRMTNRPPPTQASPFVSMILRPLKEFDETFESRTPPQVGNEWKSSAIATVSEKYSVAVEELLATVQRTEDALKNRKARRFMAGGMSDGEKVKLQLLLDYKEFARGVEELGVDGSSIEGVGRLESLTKEAESLLVQATAGQNGRP